ncbi:isopropanol dehydrogenase [Ilyonectria robusta]|uniref:isopropanol dehydrogenase n=1 Tax=Ilyonectria robusta TaxID=1079257 RepID=UPI001E8D27DB|nr:isopropanol dehydrogenase [Ilyonectria robusta]KAH8648853.1 isopropanol dehydrogenase [Ilyonectria robusta]
MVTSHNQRALVLEARGQPLSLADVPIPDVCPGSAIVKIPVPLEPPVVPCAQTIGRIHELGPDGTSLDIGQLVFVDLFTRSRDNPDDAILQGYVGGSAASMKLMDAWKDGMFAQYARMPRENIAPLNEELLVTQMGYTFADLSLLGPAAIAMGGLCEVDVQAGDSVIVAPATGLYGGSCVQVALAMGARVVAASRNDSLLTKMASTFESTGRLTAVKLTGNLEIDTAALKKATGSVRGADAGLGALRPFGRCAPLGGAEGNVEIPYLHVMWNSIRLQGRYMFDRKHTLQLIKVLESGQLKLGSGDGSGVKVRSFKIEEVEEAMDTAERELR